MEVRDVGRWRAACLVLLTGTCAVAGSPGAAGVATVPPVPAVEVTATPEQVATATFVAVTVTWRDVGGDGRYTVGFGDGTSSGLASYGDGGCELPPAGSGPVVQRVRHAYRRPGVYAVTATFESDCGVAGGAGPVYAGGAVVRVLPGATPSNGPEPPTAELTPYLPPRPAARSVSVAAGVGDPDGVLTEAVYDWGDGRREVRRHSLDGCADPPLHWPDSWEDHDLRHTYRRAGRYRLTVTVTSAGCDGHDVQTRRVVLAVTAR